jgi:enterochelin esterase family protein
MTRVGIGWEVVTLDVDSEALRGNPLGDPSRRELPLLVPVGHDAARPIPVVFVLAGFSGTGRMALQEDPWSESLQRRVERLAGDGRVGPMILALPDAFTRYGGSQYLDSAATGSYERYLWSDLLGAIKARYAVSRVGVAGKSSGGYGAIVQAMRHPEIVEAVACHSGDMAFEYCYMLDIPKAVRSFGRHGGVLGFLDAFAAAHKKRDGKWLDGMNVLAMASCYSPDAGEPLGFALPFDVDTAALRPEVWARWLARDPVRMLDEPRHADALRHMRAVFLDCGTRDEWMLDMGARMFAAKLRALGIPHVHEEFDDGHMSVTYRYDVSLPLLWRALRD